MTNLRENFVNLNISELLVQLTHLQINLKLKLVRVFILCILTAITLIISGVVEARSTINSTNTTPITRDSVFTIPTENHTYNSEGDLNYSIDESASKPSGGGLLKVASTELPTVTITATTFRVSEDSISGKIDLTIELSAIANGARFTIATNNGTAIAGEDYSTYNTILTLGADQTSWMFPITILDDSVKEGDEAFTISLSNLSGGVAQFPNGASSFSKTITIIDDESTTLAISNTDLSVAEDIGSAGFIVNLELSRAVGFNVTVSYALASGTATKVSDFTEPTNRTVTILANNTSGTFSIPINDDMESEGNESFALTLSNPKGAKFATGATHSRTITITDNEQPTISFAEVSIEVSENVESSEVAVEVKLSRTFNQSISVSYAAMDDTAINGEDYTLQPSTLTFAAGVVSISILIPISNDINHEGNESFSITLSNPTGAVFTNGTTISKEITIIDDEIPTLLVANSTLNVAENIGVDGFDLNLKLSGETRVNVSLSLAVTGGTATTGVDFNRTSIDITFAPGETSQTVNFEIIEDVGFERDETIEFTLSSLSGAVFASGGTSHVGEITIVEDRKVVTFISPTEYKVAENVANGELIVEVNLDSATNVDVKFDVRLVSETATINQDFKLPSANNTFAIEAGSTVGTFAIKIIDDTRGEGDEKFSFHVENVVGAGVLGGSFIRKEVTISDNDKPTVTLGSVLRTGLTTEGAFFGVSLSIATPADHAISYDYSVTNGTAIKDIDFRAPANSRQNFSMGFRYSGVSGFEMIDNSDTDGDKTFTINIRNLTGAEFADGTSNKSIPITIADDESLTVSITNANNFRVQEGQSELVVNATLSKPVNRNIFFQYNVLNGSAIIRQDFSVPTNVIDRRVRFAPNTTSQSFSVSIIDDSITEGSENFTLRFSSLSYGSFSNGGSTYSKLVTIEQSDLPTISIPETNLVVNENAGNLEVTVNLSHASWRIVSFGFRMDNISALKSASGVLKDYNESTSIVHTIPIGETTGTFSVQINQDTLNEGNETFALHLRYLRGAVYPASVIASNRPDRITRVVTIIDDESPTISVSAGIFEVNENVLGGGFIVNLRLSARTTRDVSLEYNMTDITTTKGMDYTEETNRSVMISVGDDRASITIPIINDEENEGNETFTLKLSNIVGAASFSNGELTYSRTVTIRDNEPPTLSVTNRNFNVMENIGNTGFVVSMRLSNPASQHVTFDYGLTAGSATESEDYSQPTNRSKSIAAGDTTDSFTIPILNDEMVEGTENFDLILRITAGAVFATGQTEKTVTISIFDDELPTLSFKTAEFSIDENDSENEIEIEVMLSVASHQIISFVYDFSDISTTKGSDYTEERNRRVAISAGQTTGKFSIPIINDEDNEGNETFTFALSGLRRAKFAGDENTISETVTIVDDESPTLMITTTDFTVDEDIGTTGFEVYVKLSGPTNQSVTFDYEMMDDSALESMDYTEESSREVTISAGEIMEKFSIPIINDQAHEGEESFTLTLSDLTGAVFKGPGDSVVNTVVIEDDENPILSLTTTNFTLAEDDVNGEINFDIKLSGATGQNVTFDYGMLDVTTIKGLDYTEATDRTVTIMAGETKGSFSIPIINDSLAEGNETFILNFSKLSGAVYPNGNRISETITIIDNDSTVLSFSTTDFNVAESVGSSGFEVSVMLSTTASRDVSFYYWMLDGSATKGVDYSEASNRSLTISAGQMTKSFTIPIIDDALRENSETFTLNLTSLSGAAFPNGNSTYSKIVTIIDDETPTITITTTNFSVGEDTGTDGITVNFTLQHTSSYDVQFTYVTENISAIAGIDYRNTTGTVTISTGDTTGSISIPILEDENIELSETFRINLATLGGAQFVTNFTNSHQLTITILDNDAPTLSIIAGPPVTESDLPGSPAIAKFVLSSPVRPMISRFRVNYTPVGATFIADSGIPSQSEILNFTDSDSDGIFTAELPITIASDQVAEENGVVTVTLNEDTFGSEKYFVGSRATALVVVNDDDAKIPELSITDIANPIAESQGMVEFTITADMNPGRRIWVNYSPAEVASGNFLTNEVATPTTTVTGLTFTTTAPYTSTLSIPLHDDQVGEATGKIRVTLNDDPATPDTYTVVSGANANAEVKIWDDDAPELILSTFAPEVTEAMNAEAVYTVSARVSPTNSFEVRYNVRVLDSQNVGNFITIGELGNKTKRLDLTGGKSDKITVPISNDDVVENDSAVFVTLAGEVDGIQHYSLSEIQSEREVRIDLLDDESLPELTIADPIDATAESAREVAFILSTTTNPGPSLMVRYDPSEVFDGNFLDSDPANNQEEISSQSVIFSSSENGQTYTGTLSVPIHDDDTSEVTGQIKVTLLEQTGVLQKYQVGNADYSATATIWDDDAPVLSIANAPNLTESANAELRFPLTTLVSPDSSISVYYSLAESTESGDGDFIAVGDEGSGKSQSVDFSGGTKSSHLVIELDADDETEGSSVVTVTLEVQPGNLSEVEYYLATPNTPVTGTIYDDDSLPLLSIADVVNPTIENLISIDFVVTSTIATSLTVRYQASEVNGGDFLTASQAETKSTSLTFAQVAGSGPFVDTLAVSIHDDEVGENTGQIKVTLLAEIELVRTYRINSDGTEDALVTIWDDDAPVISIGNAPNLTESANAELRFPLTALVSPNKSISIYYTLEESDQSGDGDFIVGGDEGSGKFQLIDFSGGSKASHLVIEIGSDDDSEGRSIVTVTLEAQPGNLSDAEYHLVSPNTPVTATVFDDDSLPILTITDVVNPVAESTGSVNFTVTSSIETSLTVRYQANEVSGGDFLTASQAETKTASLTFAQVGGSGPFVDTLAVSIHDDEVGENTGQIEVTLLAETSIVRTYQVNTDGTEDATATIWDDDAPVISISNAPSLTELTNVELRFPLTALVSPNKSISIYYTLEESDQSRDGDFIASGDEGSGKFQSVDFSGGSENGHLAIPIESDSNDEGSSVVSITLEAQPGNLSDANYNLSSPNTPATATVFDDDSLPVLRIADVTNPVAENSGSVNFAVTSSIETTLTVRYQANEVSGGDFLTASQAETNTASLTFAQVGGSGPFVDTLVVSIHDDEVGENTGQIEVTLLAETSIVRTYQVNTDGTEDATATIWDDDAPVISISNAPNITELADAELRFPLTALVSPNKSISIYYTLEESDQSGDGDFIVGGDEGLGKFQSVDFSGGSKASHLVIEIDSDDDSEGSSMVTVTLEAQPGNLSDADYNLASPNTPATTNIFDDDSLPLLSIADVVNPTIENLASIDFVVTSTIATSLTVRYQASEVSGGDFLDAVNGQEAIKTTSLTFAQIGGSGPFVDTLSVSLHNDEIGEDTGQIEVTLLAETSIVRTYQVNTDGTEDATATIWDDDAPVISISNAPNITELADAELRFPLTALVSPNKSISIYYTLEESDQSEDGDFIVGGDEGSGKFQSVDFSGGSKASHLVIEIDSDDDSEGSSMVTVTLEAQPGNLSDADYNLASPNTPATTNIFDDDSLPIMSILDVVNPAAENTGSVNFVVSTSVAINLTIRYQASEVSGGDFLDAVNGQEAIKTTSLTFAQVGGRGPFVDTLTVSIHNDEIGEDTGQIEVTLLAETSMIRTYQVNTDGTEDATATIWDDDAPVISISNAPNVTELADAELRFPLTALVSPNKSISIYYTLEESTEVGDGDFIASGDEGSGKFQSVDFSGGSKASHLVIEIDSDDDSEGSSMVTVTLEAQPGNLSDADYNLASTNTPATTNIFDDDSLPIMSILDVVNPVAENTGSVNFVVSTSVATNLTIRYQASEVSGGDFLDAVNGQEAIKTTRLTFAQIGGSGPFVDTLSVLIHNDEIGEDTGQIEVTLLAEISIVRTYQVNTDGTEVATATIWDDDAPVISIGNAPNVTELADAELQFPISALVSPNKSISIYYTLEESTESGDGDFIASSDEGSGKSQSVNFSGGSKNSHLVIEIDSDDDSEGSSMVTVTLEAQPGNLSDAEYNLAAPNTPANSIVYDEDSLPILSIADVINPVAENASSINFVVTTSVATTLAVRYQASEVSGGDFLDAVNGQEAIKTTSLTFAQVGGIGPFVDTLTVSIHDDEIGEVTGLIEVTLLTETSIVRTYQVNSDGTEDATATIWDDDAPVISISNGQSITELADAELRFPLTALVSPNKSISIYYTLVESDQSGDGDFIEGGDEGSGKFQSIDFSGGSKASHLVIEIDSDDDSEGSSMVTVTLEAQPGNLSDADYNLASPNTPATTNIFDDDSLPILSIADVANPTAENTSSIDFIVASSVASTLTVRYQASEVNGGDFLDAVNGQEAIKTKSLTFTQVGGSGPFVDTLSVSLHNDEIGEDTGQIEVTLLTETSIVRTYQVNSDGTEDATATIWDDDAPVISISNGQSITELADAELRFPLTALVSPNKSISIYYTLVESDQSGDGDFIEGGDEGSGKFQSIDFSGGSKASHLVIEIDSDDDSEGSSMVTVTLEAQPGNLSDADYNLASPNTPATTNIFDDDSLPILSIADVANPTAENTNSIDFIVASSVASTLTVRYQASEVSGGDFLDVVNGQEAIKTVRLTFAQIGGSGPFVDMLTVSIHDDEIGEDTGQIKVTLLAEIELVRTYRINSDGTEDALVTIWDDDAPVISISNAPNITELVDAELRFPLTTLVSPNKSISIYYTLAESNEIGDGNFIVGGDEGSGKFQSIDFSGGSKNSHLVIEIDSDDDSEGSSIVTVTLEAQPGNLADASYNLASPNTPVTSTIFDDDSLPILSILDVVNPVAENTGSVNFVVSTSVATNLTIRYQASEVSGGDFLDAVNGQEAIKTARLTFAQIGGSGPFVDTLSVSLHNDEIGEDTGQIEVTLLAETSIVRTYQVNTDGTEVATATIWDDDAPVISIGNAPNVTELVDAELRFPLTALVSPNKNISIYYKLAESSGSGDGDFILSSDEGSGKSQSVDFSGGSKSSHLVIEIDSDDNLEGSSTVTVTLEAQPGNLSNANYNIASSNTPVTATVSDDDSLPILSIVDVANPVAENVGSINFVVSTSIETSLTVRYQASELSGGDFLDLVNGQEAIKTTSLTFAQIGGSGPFIGTLTVSIHDDEIGEATGQIEVTLLAETRIVRTYQVNSDGTEDAVATIWDDDAPVISIGNAPNVTELVDAELRFPLTALVSPNKSISIYYTLEESTEVGDGDFIASGDEGSGKFQSVDFSGGTKTSHLVIEIDSDDDSEGSSVVTLSLEAQPGNLSDANYNIASSNTPVTATVSDDDSLPILSIVDVANPVTESVGSINFVVSTSIETSLTVRYQASELSGGDFLDLVNGQEAIKTTSLTFAQIGGSGPFIGTLTVSIHDDEIGEATGQIEVTLLAETRIVRTYLVNSDGTEDAVATIWDDDAPVISISNAPNITELTDAELRFPLTALISPNKSISIYYTLEESTEVGDGDFIAGGDEGSGKFQSVDFSGSTKTSHLVIEIDSDDNSEGSSMVTVTLEAQPGILSDADYHLASPNTPVKASVFDDDSLPILSIADVANPIAENAGSIDFIVSSTNAVTLNVRYQASEKNGGDFLTLSQAEVKSENLTFAQLKGSGTFVDRLRVSIHDDAIGEDTGQIKVTLLVGTGNVRTYQINSDGTEDATATIWDDDAPVISITNAPNTTELSSAELRFPISALVSPNKSISIYYTLEESIGSGVGDFIANGDEGTGKSQSIDFSVGRTERYLTIPIDSDSEKEGSSMVTVTLEAQSGNLSEANYNLASLNSPVTSIVFDDDTLPTLSIADVINPIAENSNSIDFIVTASAKSDLNVRYQASEVNGGDFLVIIQEEVKTASLAFAQVGGSGPFIDTLSVSIDNDGIGENTGQIEVTLLAESSVVRTYQVNSDGTKNARATIWDDDAPVISIDNAPNITEFVNAELRFPISAQVSPNKLVLIYYTLEESKQLGDGDFINIQREGVGKFQTVDFRGRINENYLIIPIISDNDSEGSSIVTVTLEAQPVQLSNAVYNLNSPNIPATTTISDDDSLPILSLVDVATPVAENTGSIDFIVISSIASTIMVHYQSSEVNGGNFLDVVNGQEDTKSASLTFTQVGGRGPFVDTLNVSIHDDEVGEATGQIEITLLAENSIIRTYQVNSNGYSTARATIWDDDAPVIAIDNAPNITELDNTELRFPLTVLVSPNKIISIYYTLAESTGIGVGDFIARDDEGSGKFQSVDFSRRRTDGYLIIPIESDTITEGDSIVTVTLESKPGNLSEADYQLTSSNTSATATISDDDTLPILSIVSVTNPVAESSGSIEFVITSSVKADLTVRYLASELSNSDFLALSQAEIKTVNLTFARVGAIGPFVDTLFITIDDDEVGEATGQIKVTLLAETSYVRTYQIKSNGTSVAMATIWDDDAPEISIENAPNITELSNAELRFPLTALVSPNQSISIYYTLEESIGNVDGDFIASGGEGSGKIQSVDFSGNSKTSFLVIAIVADDAVEGSSVITVTLESQLGDLANAEYNLASPNRPAIGTISDDDSLPVLSILDVVNPVVESVGSVDFMIAASVPSTLMVHYQVGEVNGSDFLLETQEISTTSLFNFKNTGTNGLFLDTLNVPIASDSIAEATGPIEVTLKAEPGIVRTYNIRNDGSERATALIWDDDDLTEIFIRENSASVIEGEPAIFDLMINSNVSHVNPIQVSYSVEQNGNFILWRIDRRIEMVTTTTKLVFKTFNDEVEKSNGFIRVNLINTENYISPDGQNSAKIDIIDNDGQESEAQARKSVASMVVNEILSMQEAENSAPTANNEVFVDLPSISIHATNSLVNEGEEVEFVVSSNITDNSARVRVSLEVNLNGDFFNFTESRHLSIQLKGQEQVPITFQTIDDGIAEPDGNITVSIIADPSYKINPDQNLAVIAVSDANDRRFREEVLTRMSQAFLPEVIGNMSARNSAAFSQRVHNAFNDNRTVEFKLRDQDSVKEMLKVSGEMTNDNNTTIRSILGETAFTLPLVSEVIADFPVTVWGTGDNRVLVSSSLESSQSWSGTAFTGNLGLDTKIGNDLLTGISASLSENEISMDNSAEELLEFSLNTVTFNPYFAWNSTELDAELRTMFGLGFGEFEINQANYDTEMLKTRSNSFAISGKKNLYSSNNFLNGESKVKIYGNSWFARQLLDGREGVLSNLLTDSNHIRFGAEGTHQLEFESGSILTSNISTGIRSDRKNLEELQGAEFTCGIEYNNPIGLEFSGSSKFLITDAISAPNIGLESTFGFDLGDDSLGLTLALSPKWGRIQSNYGNTLMSRNSVTKNDKVNHYSNGIIFESQIGYGFSIADDFGILTLYNGAKFEGDALEKLILGAKVLFDSKFSADLEVSNEFESSQSTKLRMRGNLKW